MRRNGWEEQSSITPFTALKLTFGKMIRGLLAFSGISAVAIPSPTNATNTRTAFIIEAAILESLGSGTSLANLTRNASALSQRSQFPSKNS